MHACTDRILLTKFESTAEYDSLKGAISTYPVAIPGTSRPVKTVKFCSRHTVAESDSARIVEKHSEK